MPRTRQKDAIEALPPAMAGTLIRYVQNGVVVRDEVRIVRRPGVRIFFRSVQQSVAVGVGIAGIGVVSGRRLHVVIETIGVGVRGEWVQVVNVRSDAALTDPQRFERVADGITIGVPADRYRVDQHIIVRDPELKVHRAAGGGIVHVEWRCDEARGVPRAIDGEAPQRKIVAIVGALELLEIGGAGGGPVGNGQYVPDVAERTVQLEIGSVRGRPPRHRVTDGEWR